MTPKTIRPLTKKQKERAKESRQTLSAFFRYGWHVLEPETPLEWNWHLDALCDHIQAALEDWMTVKRWEKARDVARAEKRIFTLPEPAQRIQNLLINVPPGTSKSRIVSVYTLPWMWLHWPSWGALFLSSNPRVAMRDALLCRDLLESDWYARWFMPTWRLRDDKNAISNYGNTSNGARLSFGYFAKIVGDRKDALFLDDPNDPDEVERDKRREAVTVRWDSSIRNRVNDLRHSVRVGVQQRTHMQDWSGHVLAKGGWEHLCIPMEYEPQRLNPNPNPAKHQIPRETVLGFRDPRTQHGELMDAHRFPRPIVETEKAEMGAYRAAGQLQQRPAPLEGGIWKRLWWGFWVPSGITLLPVTTQLANGEIWQHPQRTLPRHFEFQLQSWDMAFGKSETSSMVVGQVWALQNVDRFLLDQLRRQMDFTETQSAFRQLSGDWPQVETKLVENKANGPAIISSLKGEFSGIIAVEPEGDKVARAMAEQGTLESGHVWLPHPGLFAPHILRQLETLHPQLFKVLNRSLRESLEKNESAKGAKQVKASNYVDEFIDESAAFPNGAFKDVVDTASQALLRMRKFIAQRESSEDIPESTSFKQMFNKRR